MDTIQHVAWGFVIARAVENSLGVYSLPVEIGAAIIGALPDVVGFAEKIVKKNSTAWQWYGWFHNMDLLTAPRWLHSLVNALMLLPPYSAHVIMDKHLHEEMNRWWIWDEGMYAEVLGWFGIVIMLGIIR